MNCTFNLGFKDSVAVTAFGLVACCGKGEIAVNAFHNISKVDKSSLIESKEEVHFTSKFRLNPLFFHYVKCTLEFKKYTAMVLTKERFIQ